MLKSYRLHGRDGQLVITIPRDIASAFNLMRGQRLEVSQQDDKLVIDLDSAAPARPRKSRLNQGATA
jgi:hypothetical protein